MKKGYRPFDFIIYVLCEGNDPSQVRYVGLSARGERRIKEHFYDAHLKRAKCYSSRWIRKRMATGNIPVARILERGFLSIEALKQAERDYIAHFRRLGFQLTNTTSGGDGSWFFKRSPKEIERIVKQNKTRRASPETRAKLSQALLGNKRTLGYKPTPETRAKLSAKLLGNTRTLGYKHTDESRRKMSQASMGKKPVADSDGLIYESAAAAGRANGIPAPTVQKALRTGSTNRKTGKSFKWISPTSS